jgi:hypothetical protein
MQTVGVINFFFAENESTKYTPNIITNVRHDWLNEYTARAMRKNRK